ncbi:MAG: ACP S-malonyltransferase, partial [Alkaliphilus sp.]|nr:ACP S-malonyltransferase [Alkaliphilus sp.]
AILGMEREALEETLVLAKKVGVVEAANFNCPGQIVISGEKKAVERACEIAKEKGALKAVLLPVSAPFHSSMLKPAGAKLGSELEKIDISPLKIPVIANANADYYKNNMEVKGLLVEQVSKAVLWEDSVIKMFEFGIDTFIEIGPGKSLSQFVKKIAKNQNKNVMIYNVEDVNTLNILTQALSAI